MYYRVKTYISNAEVRLGLNAFITGSRKDNRGGTIFKLGVVETSTDALLSGVVVKFEEISIFRHNRIDVALGSIRES